MTIKTQNGKVITKGGKVSCVCCEESECCMYPADAVGRGLISSGDLPDQIEVTNTTFFDDPVIFEKIGLEYEYGGTRIYVMGGFGLPYEYLWIIEQGDESFLLNGNDAQCLITDPKVVGPNGARDLFADTYNVEFSVASTDGNWDIWGCVGFGNYPDLNISMTVERESLCEWRGSLENAFFLPCGSCSFCGQFKIAVNLFYNGERYIPDNPWPMPRWTIGISFIEQSSGRQIGESVISQKASPQTDSSPTGDYNNQQFIGGDFEVDSIIVS
jgi:hypothetical protein